MHVRKNLHKYHTAIVHKSRVKVQQPQHLCRHTLEHAFKHVACVKHPRPSFISNLSLTWGWSPTADVAGLKKV